MEYNSPPASKMRALLVVVRKIKSRAARLSQFLGGSSLIGSPNVRTCSMLALTSSCFFNTALAQGASGYPCGAVTP
jgi:hypothetical protein